MNSLRWPFPGSDAVTRSYSQAHQDLFVLSALCGKRNGTFLELGAGDPVKDSNTWLLESGFGWTGLSINKDPAAAHGFAARRACRFLLADALTLDYRDALAGFGGRIDYLSLDIDDQTLECLRVLPLDRYRFSIVTLEHDAYNGSTVARQESRALLSANEYELVFGNVAIGGREFEDWWLDAAAFDRATIDKFKRDSDEPLESNQYVLGRFDWERRVQFEGGECGKWTAMLSQEVERVVAVRT